MMRAPDQRFLPGISSLDHAGRQLSYFTKHTQGSLGHFVAQEYTKEYKSEILRHQNTSTSLLRDQSHWQGGAELLEFWQNILTSLKGTQKQRITGHFGEFLGQMRKLTGSAVAAASSRIIKPNKTSFLSNHAINKVSQRSSIEAIKKPNDPWLWDLKEKKEPQDSSDWLLGEQSNPQFCCFFKYNQA